MADPSIYHDILYPLQDEVLHILSAVDTGFYLTGGTAASRVYLHHRFSDDLDLFVNDSDSFALWTDRIIQALNRPNNWQISVDLRDVRFVRLTIIRNAFPLKIEMINDVPAHTGAILIHPMFGRIDSAENILANKITAIVSREEPKDLADIWGFCTKMDLSLTDALDNAHSKAAGIFPADVARILLSTTETDWQLIRWMSEPPVEEFIADMHALGESLIV